MKLKKIDLDSYEIINSDYIIYISRENNPATKHYLYFIDVFLHNEKEPYFDDNECFDEFSEVIDYIKWNYDIDNNIINKIKL